MEKSPNVEEEEEGRSRVIEDIAGSGSGPLAESSSRTSPSPEKGFKASDEAMKSWNIIANANNPRNRTANFGDDSSEDEPSEDEKEVFEMDLGFGKNNEIFITIKGLLPKDGTTKNIVLEQVDRGRKIRIKGLEKESNKTKLNSKLPKRKRNNKKEPFKRTNIIYP